eukprot:g51106.t1
MSFDSITQFAEPSAAAEWHFEDAGNSLRICLATHQADSLSAPISLRRIKGARGALVGAQALTDLAGRPKVRFANVPDRRLKLDRKRLLFIFG